jgi:hypothetical protein
LLIPCFSKREAFHDPGHDSDNHIDEESEGDKSGYLGPFAADKDAGKSAKVMPLGSQPV